MMCVAAAIMCSWRVMSHFAVHEGSKEETPAPVAAVKDNLPKLDAAKPDDNPLAGLFSSRKLPLCQTHTPCLKCATSSCVPIRRPVR